MTAQAHRWLCLMLLAAGCGLGLVGCGGGGGGGGGGDASGGAVPPLAEPLTRRASAASPVAAGCTGGSASGTVYRNAEVEPFAAIAPGSGQRLYAAWQQDRWSNGGALALVSAVSDDGGANWQRMLLPMSRCGGAAAGSSGDYERSTDPWIDVSPDGTVHLLGLSFTGAALSPGSVNAVLASRSIDGGRTWSAPATLVRDGAAFFNDKSALTADPTDARYVYAVWDRIDVNDRAPTMLARSVDGGLAWEAPRVIYAPASAGVSQTIGNRIVVLTAGAERGLLVNVFTQIDTVGATATARVGVVRSSDRGSTWSAPVFVAELNAVGTRDATTGRAVRDGSLLATIAAGPDGGLWVAWQDARFSAGQRDAIAISRSTDGGRSWSAPLAINRVAGAAAFTPALHVRADGLVGVLHYDLRNDTSAAATLLADAWLLSSRDGQSWAEAHVAGPFDLNGAPDAGGLFLGDYQGLVSTGASFLPVLVLSSTDAANRSDVFTPRVDVLAAAQASPLALHPARVAPAESAVTTASRAAQHEAIARALERRLPGWTARAGARAASSAAP